jgi:hypothetical protein
MNSEFIKHQAAHCRSLAEKAVQGIATAIPVAIIPFIENLR